MPEQFLGVINAADREIGLDQPGRADVEAALQPGQPVVVAVPEDGGSDAKRAFGNDGWPGA